MRNAVSAGIALVAIGAAGLVLPEAAPELAAARADTNYLLAISVGPRLAREARPERGESSVGRQLSGTRACAGLLRLGPVDVGYHCTPGPGRQPGTAGLPHGRIAEAHGL